MRAGAEPIVQVTREAFAFTPRGSARTGRRFSNKSATAGARPGGCRSAWPLTGQVVVNWETNVEEGIISTPPAALVLPP